MIREARLDEHGLIMERLLALKAKSPASWMHITDEQKAARSVMEWLRSGDAYVVGGYFIAAYTGTTWYSDKEILFEEIILKLYPTCETVMTAVEALETLARELGCVGVIAGDTQIGYMLPFYKGAGYQAIGTQLYKEIVYGSCPEVDGSRLADQSVER